MSERGEQLYYAEGFRGSFKKYIEIKDSVEGILAESAGDIFIRHGDEEYERLMKSSNAQAKKGLSSFLADAALLREQNSDEIVGFTYAFPASISRSSLYVQEQVENDMSADTFEHLQGQSAEVGWTAISEAHRGKGGWSLMMETLEARLKARDYDYMTRFARVDNGYADKIKQRYGEEKIVYEFPYEEADYMGKQVYFRTKLK